MTIKNTILIAQLGGRPRNGNLSKFNSTYHNSQQRTLRMGILSYIIRGKDKLALINMKRKRGETLLAHTKEFVANRILLTVILILFAFFFLIPLLVFLSTDIDDNSSSESTKITNTLINYRGAAMYYLVDNDGWPSVGDIYPTALWWSVWIIMQTDRLTRKSTLIF